MKYYGAPMEGVNTAFYRNAQQELVGGIDRYFSPFLVPNGEGVKFKKKQLFDLLPERNEGIELIPQILTNNAEDFIRTAQEIRELGYQEVNLNLGCPSGTVVAKKKGSGFLAFPQELDEFLDKIFTQADIKISIKTRLGKDYPEEIYGLLEIYNQYPMTELIVHPRIQKEMYKYPPHMEIFGEVLKKSKNKVCYNGDIFTPEDGERIAGLFPELDSMMLGRGLIANPALVREITTGMLLTKAEVIAMHNRIFAEYQDYLSGDTNLLYRMKEYWYYMSHCFLENKKLYKKIRKATKLDVYQEVVQEIFETLEVGGYFDPYSK